MSDDPNQKILDQYVSHSVESSTRTRRVLIIMITASILGFAAFWNSRQGSWLNSRIALSQDTFTYWEVCQKGPLEQQNFYLEHCGPQAADPRLKKCWSRGAEDFADMCRRVERYRQNRRYVDPKEVTERTTKLEELKDENVLRVRIPFFGVEFDVNDLGIIGGATFVILLLWFRFALYQELRNLDITFRFAASLDNTPNWMLLRFTYQNLSMGQVLATPPKLYLSGPPQLRTSSSESRLRRLLLTFWHRYAKRGLQIFWDNISKLLYLLPLIVQLIICVHDRDTYYIAAMLSPKSAPRIINASYTFLFIAYLLTLNCLYISLRTSQLWRKRSDQILRGRPALNEKNLAPE